MKRQPLLASAVALVALSGCAVGPDYQRPDVDLPASYRGSLATPTDAGDKTPAFSEQDWRQVFTDPTLQQLIEEALRAGPDALLAAERLREAQALAGVARAPVLPQVSASLSTSPTVRASGDTVTSSFLGGVGISWELDLWGRYRRSSEAARAELLASAEAQYGVRASLIAGVARTYCQLVTLRDTLAVTQSAAQTQEQVLRLIKRLSASGVASAAEERQQESVLATTQARLPTLRRQINETENALSLLLGRHPGALSTSAGLRLNLPQQIPVGLPSTLLERRPDIRQAEAQLVAANARIGEARAMFFPTLSLTAMLGGVSTQLSDVLGGGAPTVASLGPNVLMPLFDGRRLMFNQDAAMARMAQALVSYRKTILGALGEVANGLSAYDTSTELLGIQRQRVAIAREAMRLAELRFRAGTTGFIEVLDAQRQLLATETEQAQTVLDQRTALIGLYLALGGGWSAADSDASVLQNK